MPRRKVEKGPDLGQRCCSGDRRQALPAAGRLAPANVAFEPAHREADFGRVAAVSEPSRGAATLQSLMDAMREPALPVILSSGYSVEQASDSLDEFGKTTFLAQPYTRDRLIGALRRALDA